MSFERQMLREGSEQKNEKGFSTAEFDFLRASAQATQAFRFARDRKERSRSAV